MKLGWYRCWHWLCVRVYFERITVLGAQRLPRRGSVLYLGLHRNGAVDGFVYSQVLPRATFLVSTQLLRGAFSRLFFHGIAVARPKDVADRSQNRAALDRCVNHLVGGGELFVFPEGTSALGPRHLPFKSGAVQLALETLERGRDDLQVVPLGIHYECAWGFRSKVEVVVGESVSLKLGDALDARCRFRELKRRMTLALEEVGVNVRSEEEQQQIESLAYAATLGTQRSYFESLKALEQNVPESIQTEGKSLSAELERYPLLNHQGVPLFPRGPTVLYALLLVALAPVVLIGLAFNLPPLMAAGWAGKRFADDRNVITLWRILIGLPSWILWCALVCGGLLWLGEPWWIGVYALVTWGMLRLYYRTKKLTIAVHNVVRAPGCRSRLLRFREHLLRHLPIEP